MPTFFINEIKDLKASILNLETDNFLIPEESRFRKVLDSCASLLKKHNHVVKYIPKMTNVIKDYKGLVRYFYYLLENIHPETIPFKDEIIDIVVAKAFVKRIQELTELDLKSSLGMCAKLIEIIFKFEKDFNFDPGTLYNFRIFGQKEMHWVTDKAISIYNKALKDDLILVAQADKDTEEYEKTHDIKFGFDNLEELLKKHKEIN